MHVKDHLDRPVGELLHSVGPPSRQPLTRVCQALTLAGEAENTDAGVLLLSQVAELFGDRTPVDEALASVGVDVATVRKKLRPIEAAWQELMQAEEIEQLRSIGPGLHTAAAF